MLRVPKLGRSVLGIAALRERKQRDRAGLTADVAVPSINKQVDFHHVRVASQQSPSQPVADD
jgi:soluble P-type ATPase